MFSLLLKYCDPYPISSKMISKTYAKVRDRFTTITVCLNWGESLTVRTDSVIVLSTMIIMVSQLHTFDYVM